MTHYTVFPTSFFPFCAVTLGTLLGAVVMPLLRTLKILFGWVGVMLFKYST